MKSPNPYAGIGLDRVSERRSDDAWLDSLFDAEGTLVFPIWRSRNLVTSHDDPAAVTIGAGEARALAEGGAEKIFLGLKDGVAHFTVDVSHLDEPHATEALFGRGEFVELRVVSVMLTREEGGLLAYAKGITHWHARHRFCGVCGGETAMREAGHQRVCLDKACGASHFPRTDPAVIMLVSRGDRVVLGRKSEWVEGMYSTLAGFVEPGESLEEAVAREVKEEVGIDIANVRYHSSQPWPFPASLMLGFHAAATTDEISMNRDELEDARWFTRAELADGAAGIARRPRSDSIARRLIEDWIREG